MVKYSVAMTVRVICLVLCLVLPGWWALGPALGAIFLPYFAVMIANNVRRGLPTPVRRPGALTRHIPGRHS